MEIIKRFEGDLSQFTGTEKYYTHGLGNRKIFLTDGCKYVAEEAGAYWLFDVILSYQGSNDLRNEDFQVWKLEKQEREWLITCDDGNNNIMVQQRVPYSDFPLETIKFYVEDSVCMLPSER